MDKIIWNESLSVGVRELDRQHQELIKMINQLIESKDASVNSEAVSDVLTKMTKYAEYHFKSEEKILTDHDYPNLSIHEKEHIAFMKQTCTFCVDTIKHKETIPVEILSYLKKWLTNHILKSDMQYKSYLNKLGVK